MTNPVLSVSDLQVAFRTSNGWTPVVHGISFDVHAGETIAVVGESGSGKSVTALATMRLLARETSRVSGSISLQGRSLADLTAAQMRLVRGNEAAMIFQEPMTSLNPTMPAGGQIAEALTTHRNIGGKAAEHEAVRLLERVRIPAARARYHDYPHLMSGGMRQRVMIAMALACRPKLLIADEPTTALDVTVQAQILGLLQEIQAEDNLAIVFITHDMGVVAEIADRMIVMLRGNVVDQGRTAAVFKSPGHEYTRSLLAAAPQLGGTQGSAASPLPLRAAAPILEVADLQKRFDIRSGLLNRVKGRVHAVDGVSFTIRRGETLALVGESGSGKSTTGRCVAGLVRPSGGSIRIDGRDVLSANRAERSAIRQRLQMIFQDPYSSLNPRMRIGDCIAEPLVVSGLHDRNSANARVEELLDAVGLSAAMRNRFPHEFSGGQRQRICIARALALNPQLIVADEAVSALDATIKTQIVDLLLDLQCRLDLSMLFISHDMAVVERISHRVAVMYLGEIVEIGDRRSVFDNPQHPYTRQLLSAVPVADPSRRRGLREIAGSELKSPIRPVDYEAPRRGYDQVGADHFVQSLALAAG